MFPCLLEVFMLVAVNSTTFSDMTPCRLVVLYRRNELPPYSETKIIEASRTVCCLKTSILWDITPFSPFKGLCLLPASRWFLASLILRPWRWRRHLPPKRLLTCNEIRSVISQKIKFFITTAVRTSNLTQPVCLAYSVTLKMEETSSSETLTDFQWNTRLYPRR
jgi:hypothetical protein